MPSKRYADALAIQLGACNPHGIIHALANAAAEIRAEGKDTGQASSDPALRLIVHQLAHIVRVADISLDEYWDAMRACEARAELTE